MSLARGSAWLTAGLAAAGLVAAASLLVPWDWVPGGSLHPAEAHEVLTSAQIVRAEEYSAVRRYLGWSSYGVSLLVAIGLGFTSAGASLVRRTTSRLPWWAAVAVGVLLVLLVGRAATIGFGAAIRRQDLAYGLTEQSWAGWALDQVRSLGVSWVTIALVVVMVVAVARRHPRRWFLGGGAIAAGLVVAGSFLYPVLVEPVFNRFEPLRDELLRESVLDLAERQGVEVDQVLVADASRRTTTLNAYVSGFGSTRRVVLYDNLVRDLDRSHARAVVAHELAHAANRDVLLGTGLGALAAVLGVALLALVIDVPAVRRRADVDGPGDPAVVPLALALAAVATLVASPVQNTISRAVEVRADRGSLAATRDPEAFVDMQRELALASLADPSPPVWSQLWFGSHPTLLQRAGLPSSLADARGGGEVP